MNSTHHAYYQAVKSRDHRFDGRFFTGVTSTGIFCRSICPATTPKRSNCQFFTSSAAALQAGFRPCLRCRPESAPNSPAWSGTSTTVTRALNLIEQGALDNSSVEEFATRLGISERHLRRLFIQHLGANPLSVARIRRVLFAKTLISDSQFSMSDIAFTANFTSIRQFNHTFKSLYGKTPTQIRKQSLTNRETESNKIQIYLYYRPPYNWPIQWNRLKSIRLQFLEYVTTESYSRLDKIKGQPVAWSVFPEQEKCRLKVVMLLTDIQVMKPAIESVKRLFDLDANPQAIDDGLINLSSHFNLPCKNQSVRLLGSVGLFETAIRQIYAHFYSGMEVAVQLENLVIKYGEQTQKYGSKLTRFFPTPESLMSLSKRQTELNDKQFSQLITLCDIFVHNHWGKPTQKSADDIFAELDFAENLSKPVKRRLLSAMSEDPNHLFLDDSKTKILADKLLCGDPDAVKTAINDCSPWKTYAEAFLHAQFEKPEEILTEDLK